MTAIWMWFCSEWRNRWKGLLGLMVLIAFATAGVSTAVAGARRGATSIDRLLADSLPATLAVLPNMGEFDWDAVRAMPDVEAVTAFVVSSFGVEGIGEYEGEISGFPPVDEEIWRTIERPRVLEGRLPDPADAGEVVVTTNFLSHFDKSVGDDLTLRLYTPEQIDAFDEGAPEGPTVDAEIVGVIRSGWYSDPVGVTGWCRVPVDRRSTGSTRAASSATRAPATSTRSCVSAIENRRRSRRSSGSSRR